MRTVARLLTGVGVIVVTQAVPVVAVSAAAPSGTTVVKPTAEAWYRSTPACALPTGCADVPGAPSTYSADTLHVGVVAGAEEARTYLQLNLSALPPGTSATGGTLLLPVAGSTADGSRTPEAATMQACAVKEPIKDADGSFATPPVADCNSASVPATFVPAQGEDPAAFTVDLGRLVTAWTSTTPGAVALLPAADTAPPASWHVAFSDRTRTGDGVVPISATLAYASSTSALPLDPPEVDAPAFEPAPQPVSQPVVDDSPAFDSGSFAAPPVSADAPVVSAPPAQPVVAGEQVVPAALTVPGGFKYPAVFLIPLVIAAAAAWLGRALTQDLTATS